MQQERKAFKEAVEQAKHIDALSFISGYVKLKKEGQNYFGYCPFHGEKSGSFCVSPSRNTWRCFGACGEGGSVIDFVMKWHECSFSEAVKIVTGLTEDAPKVQRVQHVPVERTPAVITMEEVLKYHENFELALPYLTRRAISEQVGREHLIGIEWFSYKMKDMQGNVLARVSYPRYTIPHMVGGKVFNIKKRADGRVLNAVVWNALQVEGAKLLPYEQYIESRYDVPKAEYDVLWRKAVEKDCGRFTSVPNAKIVPFNIGDFLEYRDGRWVTKQKLRYLLITSENKEGDALSLKSRGYHTVGYTNSMDIGLLASCVQGQIIVLGENDGNVEMENRCAGIATRINAESGGKVSAIARPSGDAKDFNDLCVQGTIESFLEQYGIGQAF